jgi:hypothetical protein
VQSPVSPSAKSERKRRLASVEHVKDVDKIDSLRDPSVRPVVLQSSSSDIVFTSSRLPLPPSIQSPSTLRRGLSASMVAAAVAGKKRRATSSNDFQAGPGPRRTTSRPRPGVLEAAGAIRPMRKAAVVVELSD